MQVLRYGAAVFLGLHGIAHLVGFTSLWNSTEASYALAGGLMSAGPVGMHILAVLWLLGAIGCVVSAFAWVTRPSWWRAFMVGTLALSSVMIALDWAKAFPGGVINAVILVLMGVGYLASRRASPLDTATRTQ